MKHLGVKCIYILIMFTFADCGVEDYWNDDYDETRNCKEENLIKELSKETPSRCATVKEAGIHIPHLEKREYHNHIL